MTTQSASTKPYSDQGEEYNCGTPYGERREYARIPAVVSSRGHLTNFHETDDGLIGERVTPESATHFLIHELTIIPTPETGA